MMPVLTEIQRYTADILRQLSHVLRVYDDGEYYLWPGAEPDPERAAVVDVMLAVCGGSLPIIGEVPRYPRGLLFFVPAPQSGAVLPYRVYTPGDGEEAECRVAAEGERQPIGHACVFVISDKRQIPLLRISHPHIFALARGDGTYEFLDARVN